MCKNILSILYKQFHEKLIRVSVTYEDVQIKPQTKMKTDKIVINTIYTFAAEMNLDILYKKLLDDSILVHQTIRLVSVWVYCV